MLDTMGMDTVGEDEIVLGAAAARPMHALARPANRFAVQRPHWMPPAANAAGISAPKEELDFLPFDPITFTSATTGTLILLSFPQRPFRGERLIATAVATIGGVVSDALFRLAISPAIYVGAVQVGATQGQTPLSAFAPTAFGVRLSLPTAGQGTRVAIPLVLAGTLAAGDSIVVSGTLIGRAMR